MATINPLIQWWMTPKLPIQHIKFSQNAKPISTSLIIRLYLFRFLFHPIKRRFAKLYLLFLTTAFGLKVVAITGSAGKTTTKEMTASILGQLGDTVASYKNIDPVYNIPTTILKCRPWTKYLVLEFGVEFPGEMDFYLWLAKPDASVITNVFPTHTEFFGDVIGVANEKLKIIQQLKGGNWAILNLEDKFLNDSSIHTNARIVWYGKGSNIFARRRLTQGKFNTALELYVGVKKIKVTLPTMGSHYVSNALAASAVAKIFGATSSQTKKGLESFVVPEHRERLIKHRSGAIIIDDSYNNNPEAAKVAINSLVEVFKKRKKVIVFGDMLELGRDEKKYHQELGEFMAKKKIDYLIGVGKASKVSVKTFSKQSGRNRAFWVEDQSQVEKVLEPLIKKNTAILIKGSRSIGLDKLVSKLFAS